MNLPLLSDVIGLIESAFSQHAPEIVQAAGDAAATTAVTTAETDPKVQAATSAAIALYTATQNFKTVVQSSGEITDAPVKPT